MVDPYTRRNQGGSSPRVRGTRTRPTPRCRRFRFIPACAGNSESVSAICETHAVHPRVCGELGRPPTSATGCRGSSPRVRGTPAHSGRGDRRQRFIPACAGNSRAACVQGRRRAVHPRVCGELAGAAAAAVRVRRFIPACAGNSPTTAALGARSPVHPRVCGELETFEFEGVAVTGSSPRVRGTPPLARADEVFGRFIPACAGNSRRHANT